jgi:PhzF family phenazine biosynthesis protein
MTPEIMSGFNICPVAAYLGKTDYMLIFDNEEQISNIIPDYPVIEQWPVRGVIVTAPGVGSDFVSRFFAPQSGVNEDPVTGSAHTSLTPYWSAKLNKNELTAIQLSPRRGFLQCTNLQDRV